MPHLQRLLDRRMRIHTEYCGILSNAPTSESRAKLDRMLADIESLTKDIQAAQRTQNADGFYDILSSDERRKGMALHDAYVECLRYGVPGEHKALVGSGASAEARSLVAEQKKLIEKRDQQAGTQAITYTEGSVGGYFVPAGFVYDIDQATKYYADLMTACRVIETATGAVLPWPTSNDTDNAWHILGEGSQISDQGATPNYPTQGTKPTADAGNVALGNTNFNAWKGSTGLIRVSLELLQDSAFDFEEFLKEQFAERLGRGYEVYFTNGTGSAMPTGIFPAYASSSLVPVTAVGSNANDGSGSTGANSIGYQDLINVIHAVDPNYRRKAKFMFHDNILAKLQTLLDKYGRPLWQPSMIVGAPDTVCGYPFVINQSFPVLTASATTVMFGDWSKFVIRKVKGLQILRLDERFADSGEVAFLGFSRVDSNLVNAGGNFLSQLIQHS